MAYTKTEKQAQCKSKSPRKHSKMGPLLVLMSIFTNPAASAEVFRLVRWPNGVYCPECQKPDNIKRRGKYKKHLQRYHCKTCGKSFNDKTGTILHYKHVGLGQWLMFIWGFFGGPANGMSINYLSREIMSYSTAYYLIKDIITMMYNLATEKLSGIVECDEGYVKAGSKGMKIDGNGRRTIPSRRILPRGPGRGTYEKDTPMVTAIYQRCSETGRDCIIYGVSKGVKKLAQIVADTVKPGSTVYTDEYKAYNSLEKIGYDHHTVNHSEGEYASGEDNEIHTNNCECLVGLLKWWQKKHRGVSKQNLHLYTKSYEFIRNHRHCDDAGRLLVTMSVALGTYQGRETYSNYNERLADIVQAVA